MGGMIFAIVVASVSGKESVRLGAIRVGVSWLLTVAWWNIGSSYTIGYILIDATFLAIFAHSSIKHRDLVSTVLTGFYSLYFVAHIVGWVGHLVPDASLDGVYFGTELSHYGVQQAMNNAIFICILVYLITHSGAIILNRHSEAFKRWYVRMRIKTIHWWKAVTA